MRTPPDFGSLLTGSKNDNKTEYVKFKNTKWVFHGISRTKSRYSNVEKTRVAYLLDPTSAAPIVTVIKYILPLALRDIHAFHPKVDEIKKFKLALALLSTSKSPSLKEKLFKRQKGMCHICYRAIDEEYLHLMIKQ